MSRFQYRLTVNDTEKISDECPDKKWNWIAKHAERRGGVSAKLEERCISNKVILGTIPKALEKDYNIVDDLVISPWYIIAEIDGRR